MNLPSDNIKVSEFTSNDHSRTAIVYDNIKTGKFWIHFVDTVIPENCMIKVFEIEEDINIVEDEAENWVSE